jgi:5-methylthioadenosine/S-adenosylhomocysteine deaminase
MTADVLIENARYALMTDEDGGTREHVSIAITDGVITSIGDPVPAHSVIDARGALVMPGLVNLHTHLPMTLLRGIAEDVDLQGFLERVWAEEARIMDAEGVYAGARLGAVEALLSGTTTALDMYFHPEAGHRAAVEAGLRHITGPVFFSFPGPDGLEWDERVRRAHTWPQTLEDIGGPYVPAALMPHAAFTVGIDHLAEIVEIASAQGAMITTHASENDQENADTVAATGLRPIGALDAAGVLECAPVLGHGVRLNATERQRIAQTGTSIAHCPGSNLKLGSGAADVVGYREDGIGVGLGTDGCSSSNDLDMFAAMRLTANLARLVREDPAAISAREVVALATLEGARALGLEGRIGTIEVGKEADLVVLDLQAPHLLPVHDPYTLVVFSAGRGDVRDVLVAGSVVVRDREPTRVALADVMERAAEVVGVER